LIQCDNCCKELKQDWDEVNILDQDSTPYTLCLDCTIEHLRNWLRTNNLDPEQLNKNNFSIFFEIYMNDILEYRSLYVD